MAVALFWIGVGMTIAGLIWLGYHRPWRQHRLHGRLRLGYYVALADQPPGIPVVVPESSVWTTCHTLNKVEEWLDWLDANGFPPCEFSVDVGSSYVIRSRTHGCPETPQSAEAKVPVEVPH